MMKEDEIREMVRQKYAERITEKTCCGSSVMDNKALTDGLYCDSAVGEIPKELLSASCGCGNPTARAQLRPGEVVLDVGSGAGLDVLLAARIVGSQGKVYGLDMTDEMLAVANANKEKAGATNVEFLKGQIEDIPLSEGAVDVVISNCVINLTSNKDQVFHEIFRVLKPGGRMGISDIITVKPMPDDLRQPLLSWVNCVTGALSDSEYRTNLPKVGFENIEVEITRTYDLTSPAAQERVPGATLDQLQELNGSIVSAFIRARKPA